MDRQQARYKEVKGIQIQPTITKEIIDLGEGYEYAEITLNRIASMNGIAIYINEALDNEYIKLDACQPSIIIEETDIKKISVKALSEDGTANMQIILKR